MVNLLFFFHFHILLIRNEFINLGTLKERGTNFVYWRKKYHGICEHTLKSLR